MSFAQPWWLLLLGLGAVVVALHLRRRRTAEIGSVFLWQRIGTRSNSRATSNQPVFNVFLLLQLLALVGLALALARPYVATWQDVNHEIIVVDASLSMLGPTEDPERTRFDAALAYARDLVSERGPAGARRRVSLVVAATEPRVEAARARDGAHLDEALERMRSTHGGSGWDAVERPIGSAVREAETTRLTVLTDEPDVATDALDDADLSVDQFAAHGFGVATDNLALSSVRAQALEDDPERVIVTGSVRAFGAPPEEVTLDLRFTPTGTSSPLSWGETTVSIRATGAEGAGSFETEVRLPDTGVLTVSLPDDALSFDNRASFVVRDGVRTLQVLHVGSPNSAVSRVLEASGYVEASQVASLPEDASAYDLVVVNGVEVSSHPGTNTLWVDALPPGHRAASEGLASPQVTGWDANHVLSEFVTWGDVDVQRARAVPRLDGADVLLQAGNAPLVQVRATPAGHDVVFAFTLKDSNWSSLLGFPNFFENVLTSVFPDAGQRMPVPCVVGRPCPRDAAWQAAGWSWQDPQGTPLPWAFKDRGQDDSHALAEPFQARFHPKLSGIFRGTSGSSEAARAVHPVTDGESDLRVGQASEVSAPASATTGMGLEPWAWVVLVVAAIVLLEAVLVRVRRPSGANAGRRTTLGRWLRIATVIFLALAILQVPGYLLERQNEVVFVVDDPSILAGEDREHLETTLRAADDRVGTAHAGALVRVSAVPSVVADLGGDIGMDGLAAADRFRANRLGDALDLAGGLVRDDRGSRIVLLSTGRRTQGLLDGALQNLARRGVPVDVVPLGGLPRGEHLMESVTAPRRTTVGEAFWLEGIARSEASTTATVRILRSGESWAEQDVQLQPGRNLIRTRMSERDPGAYRYEMDLVAEGDTFGDNDRSGTIVEVEESPRIGIFTPQPSWGQTFANALAPQGFDVSVHHSSDAPHYLDHDDEDLHDWLDYDVVILMNVPALELSVGQQEMLAAWVQEYGGGLVVLGGENTFGPGGYYETQLEEVLPLSTEIPQEKPRVAMSFVVDRSGSMRQAVGDVQRLDIAKQATLSAAELLSEESSIGVVAFDSEARVLVPLQPAGDTQRLEEQLAPLTSGGGTSILPGLEQAHAQLSEVDEDVTRHIVVMTDGLSQPGDFESTLTAIREDGITVSTAAIGRGADAGLIEDLARWGGGAAHVTEDFEALPSILAQEALLLSDDPVQDTEFTPTWGTREVSFLDEVGSDLPVFGGFVAAGAKATADVHLYGPDERPLLASWRYGLGRVVAFASHGAGPWAEPWFDHPTYPRLWSQIVRWTGPTSEPGGPGLHVRRDGDEVVVTFVPASSNDGEVSGPWTVALHGPDVEVRERLWERPPGVHGARLSLGAAGEHRVVVTPTGGGAENADAASGISERFLVPYAASLQFDGTGGRTLAYVAGRTGGTTLLGAEGLGFEAPPVRWARWAAWPLWLLVAVALLLIELTTRYAPYAWQWRPSWSSWIPPVARGRRQSRT